MATRYGVGWINEPVKLLDEYQMSVPKKYVTLIPLDVAGTVKGLTKKGEPETDEDVAARLATAAALPRKVMCGKPKLINGVWNAVYSPVGEIVVKSIEKAAQMMGSPVHITGEYLMGLPEEGWGGAH